MTGLLASVANLDEALLVEAAGVDIIDLKAPDQGALGALKPESVAQIVESLAPASVVSATIGDLPMQPEIVLPAVSGTWASGVDYVKIGFFSGGDWNATIAALTDSAKQGARLIAVFFADCDPDTRWFEILARAGFTGVMLDTRDKNAGSLRQILSHERIGHFVNQAKEFGLLCGLAGSLTRADIEPLLEFSADYLGFRGALCKNRNRIAQIDPAALHSIREIMDQKSMVKANLIG